MRASEDHLSAEIKSKETEITDLIVRSERLENETKSMDGKIQSEVKAVGKLQAEITQLESERAMIETQKNEMQSVINTLQSQVRELEVERDLAIVQI